MNDRERAMAMERMIHAHGSELLRLCLLLLGDRASAEDALQDTFVKAWRGLDGFRGDANERTWLTRIAVNTCRDCLKSAWRRRVTVDLDACAPSGEAPGADARDDTVTRAVFALPPKYKAVVLLRYYMGMPAKQIASVLSLNEHTVTTRLLRARQRLENEQRGWYSDEE